MKPKEKEEHWKISVLEELVYMLFSDNKISRPSIDTSSIWDPVIKITINIFEVQNILLAKKHLIQWRVKCVSEDHLKRKQEQALDIPSFKIQVPPAKAGEYSSRNAKRNEKRRIYSNELK